MRVSNLFPMAYEVQTPVFEGPFDLLLHLILREQVDLYEISLKRIVDAYLAELDRMETVDLEIATEFLLIAATLVELKTRRLLPGDTELDLDDELALWDERDLLLARLVDCKMFKDVAGVLNGMAAEAGRSFPRLSGPDERFLDLTPDCLDGVTPDDLRAAFLRAAAPQAAAAHRSRPRRADPGFGRRRGRRAARRAAARGAHQLSEAHRPRSSTGSRSWCAFSPSSSSSSRASSISTNPAPSARSRSSGWATTTPVLSS